MNTPQIGDLVRVELVGTIKSVEQEDSGKIRVRISGEDHQYAAVVKENIKEIVKCS